MRDLSCYISVSNSLIVLCPKLIINKELASKIAEVSIYNINGALIIKENFNTHSINVEAYNLGTGLKIFTAKVGGYLFVKKIIIK